MPKKVILLSGAIASGKTTLGDQLALRYDALVVKTSQLLADQLGRAGTDRLKLQERGQRLDKETGGAWVADALLRRLDGRPEHELVVVDAVRVTGQIDAIRRAFGNRVVHIHLTASTGTLTERYELRRKEGRLKEPGSYADARRNRTEARVEQLASEADVVIVTDRNTKESVLTRAVAALGVRGEQRAQRVDVLVGGQYGSEGKGNVAAYLSPEYDLLIRSGGPNAGHSVMTDDGKHVQHHLPSGTKLCDAKLLLTAGAVIYPPALLKEIAESGVDVKRLTIDPHATVITDAHKSREAKLAKTIGSTASGVGAATAGRIMGRSGGTKLAKDIKLLHPYLRDGGEVLEDSYANGWSVFIEGTQGSGLSLLHGPYPHVTSRDTTVSGLLAEAGIPPRRVRKVVMVCRTYPIRVESPKGGTSGPMPGELTWDEVARRSGLDPVKLKEQEKTTTTKRDRRVAEFDWQLLDRSSMLNGPTDIAVTFTDQISAKNESARRFEQLTDDTIQFIEEVERVAGAPATLISTRFHRRSIIDRRSW